MRRVSCRRAVERARIDVAAGARTRAATRRWNRLALDVDDLLDRQAVLLREREVALVVARHRHHGALAVAHEHVVADPDLDLLAGDGMEDEEPVGMPFFSIVASSASCTPPSCTPR
jgi:anti-sigma factor ChrR (cupin superfamily)